MVGHGNGNLENPVKNEDASKIVAKHLVLEIVANALDITHDNAAIKTPAVPLKKAAAKEKPAAHIRGTGDQRGTETLEAQGAVLRHLRARKKNRLTDLVKNSKQVLAKMISSESPHEEKKDQKKPVELTDVACMKGEPSQSSYKGHPEHASLPKEDANENVTAPSETPMEEVNLDPTKEDSGEKKRMTFPRAAGLRAKSAFMAKCRTLKKEAINFNKKKWDVGGRIAIFFRKKGGNHSNGEGSKRQQAAELSDVEEDRDKYQGQ